MSNRDNDNNETIKRYKRRLARYGYSKETLGWFKGKQELRYDALIRDIPKSITSISDIGCGLGDGISVIKKKFDNIEVTGIDLVSDFIDQCRVRFPHDTFTTGDYFNTLKQCDAVIASGIFNHNNHTNYTDIKNLICLCKDLNVRYLSFDLLSDNVDFKTDHNHYSNVGEISNIIQEYTRRYTIMHSLQPFEFTVFLDFQDAFDSETSRYVQ